MQGKHIPTAIYHTLCGTSSIGLLHTDVGCLVRVLMTVKQTCATWLEYCCGPLHCLYVYLRMQLMMKVIEPPDLHVATWMLQQSRSLTSMTCMWATDSRTCFWYHNMMQTPYVIWWLLSLWVLCNICGDNLTRHHWELGIVGQSSKQQAGKKQASQMEASNGKRKGFSYLHRSGHQMRMSAQTIRWVVVQLYVCMCTEVSMIWPQVGSMPICTTSYKAPVHPPPHALLCIAFGGNCVILSWVITYMAL